MDKLSKLEKIVSDMPRSQLRTFGEAVVDCLKAEAQEPVVEESAPAPAIGRKK